METKIIAGGRGGGKTHRLLVWLGGASVNEPRTIVVHSRIAADYTEKAYREMYDIDLAYPAQIITFEKFLRHDLSAYKNMRLSFDNIELCLYHQSVHPLDFITTSLEVVSCDPVGNPHLIGLDPPPPIRDRQR